MNEFFEEEYTVTLLRDVRTGKVANEVWKDRFGNFARPHGPHHISYDLETGNWEHTECDPDPGKPTSVWYDPKTKNPIREDYFNPVGKLHRDIKNGGAVVHLNPETQEVIKEFFYLNGVPVDQNGNKIDYEDPFDFSP